MSNQDLDEGVTSFGLRGLDIVQATSMQEFLTELTDFLGAEYKKPWSIRESQDGTFVVTARIYGEQHE